ncbi:MAG: Smr/MutS family protein [Chitinivibrionales bacterium]|nr:Smr/MutS family protein [Chitinivibrionales bacterium]
MKKTKPNKNNAIEYHEEILKYLDTFGVQDKDISEQKKKIIEKKQEEKRHGVVRKILDLHGMREFEAEKQIKLTIRNCRETGVQELLIIHGYGLHSKPGEGPVLKSLVLSLLEHSPALQIKSFKPAALRDGGAGATLVYLR